MSYEVEAIANPNASVMAPSANAPIMRPEREIDPYQVRGYRPTQAKQEQNKEPIGQPDKVKEGLPVEPKASEETVKLSTEMAAKAKREAQYRQQQQLLQKERAALAAEKEELTQLRAMNQKLAAKDYSGLEGLVDYNEYSQYQVNKLNSTDPTQEELKTLKGEIQDLKKTTEENLTKQFEAAVNERRIAAKQLVSTNPEFAKVKKAKAEEAVVQHILDTWEHDSEELSVEQAAKEVQEILMENARKWAALLEDEKEAAVVEEQKKALPPLKPGIRTLTNQVTAGSGKGPQKPLYEIRNDQERWEEARRRAEARLQTR